MRATSLLKPPPRGLPRIQLAEGWVAMPSVSAWYKCRPSKWVIQRANDICAHKEVAWESFTSKTRDPRIVEAREIVFYVLREYMGWAGHARPSFPEIAVSCGRNNHSSIITAYRRACANPERVAEAESIAEKLGLRKLAAPRR